MILSEIFNCELIGFGISNIQHVQDTSHVPENKLNANNTVRHIN